MKKIAAMLPCYNEALNVAPLTEKWLALAEPFREKGYELNVLLIDDCSTDDSPRVFEALVQRCPERVRALRHAQNQGLGGAVRTAFETFAKQYGPGDLLVLMDGDNTHDPAYALRMLDKIEAGSDCVIASRYEAGATVRGVSRPRLFLSDGARWYYTLLLGVKGVKDYTCGYRAYTWALVSRALQAYGGELVERRSFACMMEVLYKLSLLGARFSEVPFALRYDHKLGESKMRILKTVQESLWTALVLRLNARRLDTKIRGRV